MSGLLFLTNDDFNIQKGTKGNIMCNTIPGFSLILFYSTHCEHCQNLIPVFKKLPGTIAGCQFGMINVSTNRACVDKAKNTIAPIRYVPYILLYVNGRPYIEYKGPSNLSEIQRFIIETTKNLTKKQTFSQQRETPQQGKKKIPKYSIGIPVYGKGNDNVCYLEFDTAYTEGKRN